MKMGEEKKKEFKKIDIQQFKIEEEPTPDDVNRAVEGMKENVEKKKKLTLA